MHDSPLILGLVSDLYFTVKIENAAKELGFRVEWIERAAQVAPDDAPEDAVPERQLAEPLKGQIGAFYSRVVGSQPALILLDLNNAGVPWPQWLSALKSSPATRRIPVLAFGSHMDVDAHRLAQASGADAVLAKSRFVEALPQLIQKHARVVDTTAFDAACREPLSELAVKGMELFNAGRYFEAHEELELAWKAEAGPGRELYRAILQVAVAYLQITRHNFSGALKMFMRVQQWLGPLPDECRGVDIARLRTDAMTARDALMKLGEGGLDQFDSSLLKNVIYREG